MVVAGAWYRSRQAADAVSPPLLEVEHMRAKESKNLV